MDKKQKIGAALIVILVVFAGSVIGLSMFTSTPEEEITEEEQESGVKEDVKIYDLIWNPVLYRGNVPASYVQLSFVGEFSGKEDVLRIQNQRLSAQYGVKSDFRKVTYGVVLFSIYHNEPESRNYVIQFKNNDEPVLLIQESLTPQKWHNFKILFNSEAHQYRTYLNGELLYEGRSFAEVVDFINGIEIYGGNNGYALTYLAFDSIIGYEKIA